MSERNIAARPKAPSLPGSIHNRLLQRQCACGTHRAGGGECAECSAKKRSLQRRLTIGATDDPLEREANRVADQVLTASGYPVLSDVAPRFQRYSVQTAEDADAAPASVDRALQSHGRPLEPPLRREMERRFGYDFSRVRVHSGSAAEKSAQEVHADAYTIGQDIVFGAGRFLPETREGRHLIAHELTHVVQQGAALPIDNRVARHGNRSSPRDGQAALQSGAFGIRLLLPSGERWIGPPLIRGVRPSVSVGPVPASESTEQAETERIGANNAPLAISRQTSSRTEKRIQRRARFTNPSPVAQDPLARLISGDTPGLTTPTINGNVVSTAADVLSNISPTAVAGSAAGSVTTCQFDSAFTIDTSANVIVANNPGPSGWTGTIPLAFLGNPPACAGGPASIPGVMVATPSNADFVTRVRNSEQEHVDTIRELHDRHFVTYDASVTGLRATGPTLPDCATNLMARLGTQPTQAGIGFLLGYAAETERLDGPGGTHSDTAAPTFARGCNSVTLTVGQTNAPIPGASRGNVVTVAPTVTRYDHLHLSVSGNNVVETDPANAGASRVIHSFSSAANARAGLHVFMHYGTTSKNTIGNMTYLLLAGNAAPAGTGAALAGVTEESIDPARIQVTLGVPGATDWAVAQVDGNNIRIIVNFGAKRDQAFSGVEVLRRLGVTKFAFIGSRNSADLMFFRL